MIARLDPGRLADAIMRGGEISAIAAGRAQR